MQDEFIGLKIIRTPEPLDIKVFVDVSTSWEIGLVLDGRWLAWEFKDGWRLEGHEIGWAEMVTVELAVWMLITGGTMGCHIMICLDNQGVVGMLRAGRSWGTQQNMICWEVVKLIQEHNLWISTT